MFTLTETDLMTVRRIGTIPASVELRHAHVNRGGTAKQVAAIRAALHQRPAKVRK